MSDDNKNNSMSWFPAAITGAASLLSGKLGIDASRKAEDRAFARNHQLMQEQNAFNVNMWNRSNEYNSPSNQLKLLKEAGVNPAVSDFFGGSGSTASEVTSATSDSPYNNEIGSLYQKLDPSDKVLQSLSTDAQIAKLRTDIAYQKMLNEDFKLRLDAAKEGLPMPLLDSDSDYYYDDEGNIVMDVTNPPSYNQYQERRANERLGLQGNAIRNQLSADELEVYEAGMPFLKKMPEKQLKSLEHDIRQKLLNNTLLDGDVQMMKEYGISPHDQSGWTSFLKAILRNPDAVTNVFRAFGNAFGSTGDYIGNAFRTLKGYGGSHRSPKGTW